MIKLRLFFEDMFDAGVKAQQKSMDYVLKLAYKDGYDKGFTDGIDAAKTGKECIHLLLGENDKNNSTQED